MGVLDVPLGGAFEMDLDSFIIRVFCQLDDALRECFGHGQVKLRRRGPNTILSDSEVLAMEVVGEYLGLRQDKAIFAYFRKHYSHFLFLPCAAPSTPHYLHKARG
jgi:hypothetical protein